MTPRAFVALVAFAGCATPGDFSSFRPGEVPIDAGDPIDFAESPDIGEAPDLAVLPDMAMAPDLVPVPDLAIDCSTARASCREHLATGCAKTGTYKVAPGGMAPVEVHCDMQADGGGWALVYSNSNNWADPKAAAIPTVTVNGHAVLRWFDSTWRLERARDPKWLGKPWKDGPLTPDLVGAANVRALYEAGMKQIRFEFIEGASKETASGWCEPMNKWDWRAENLSRWDCRAQGMRGSDNRICLSGASKCDMDATFNSGWANNIALGDARWDYAFQGAQNTVNPDVDDGGALTGFMVAGWRQQSHANNAADKDYQVRIWLR